jgi:AraC-like DNA-binding protein
MIGKCDALPDAATPEALVRRLAEWQPFASQVAAALAHGGDLASVANALGMTARSLQRRLRWEGTSFRRLAVLVRNHRAACYLADPRRSVAEVALVLGFASPAAFTRAFIRWNGLAPQRFRQTPFRPSGSHGPLDG